MVPTSPKLPVQLFAIFATLLTFIDGIQGSNCDTLIHIDPYVTWQTTQCAACGLDFTKSKDTLFVNYNGTLLNGTMFDSSYTVEKPWPAGDPFSFALKGGRVIRGFDAGFHKMCPGERRRLEIAPDFAYGASGTPDGSIPPNSTLIFSVELMGIGQIASPPVPRLEQP
ncbi:hypothetical protein FKW77_007365 [Venturia effusa]|uniref:peptidylprolyl isomerase n=1 Tax=Venturia effusa TaxID=50376 RepID=A0A517LFW4_9PEZI|nr:hypothetical protein FKW77_007365 [Venturia effusa]